MSLVDTLREISAFASDGAYDSKPPAGGFFVFASVAGSF
jgi:hypothetical protein